MPRFVEPRLDDEPGGRPFPRSVARTTTGPEIPPGRVAVRTGPRSRAVREERAMPALSRARLVTPVERADGRAARSLSSGRPHPARTATSPSTRLGAACSSRVHPIRASSSPAAAATATTSTVNPCRRSRPGRVAPTRQTPRVGRSTTGSSSMADPRALTWDRNAHDPRRGSDTRPIGLAVVRLSPATGLQPQSVRTPAPVRRPPPVRRRRPSPARRGTSRGGSASAATAGQIADSRSGRTRAARHSSTP